MFRDSQRLRSTHKSNTIVNLG
nr:unnamed protein product [Callosobruchus chinensis]